MEPKTYGQLSEDDLHEYGHLTDVVEALRTQEAGLVAQINALQHQRWHIIYSNGKDLPEDGSVLVTVDGAIISAHEVNHDH